jgi:hypothetical protein
MLELTSQNYKEYLSQTQYYAMHPLNGRFSAWIDDKLTLKYLCAGTALDAYMPEYYFQIDEKGNALPLMDHKTNDPISGGIVALLQEKSELAVKRLAGSIGEGFYKAEYKNGEYRLNGKTMSEAEFRQQIAALRNYLVIEYLHPHEEMARFCPDTVNCIRCLLGRMDGKMQPIVRFIRFGTKASGFVENYNAGGVLCYLDENGRFTEGNCIDPQTGKNKVIRYHPDYGTELKGSIPLWDKILLANRELDRYFPQLNYIGIDYVVTDKNEVKILEINSLSSLDTLEMKGSVFHRDCGAFYRSYL